MRYSEYQPLKSFPRVIDPIEFKEHGEPTCFARARHTLMIFGFGPTIMLAISPDSTALRVPGVHTITSNNRDTFEVIQQILTSGFRSPHRAMNVYLPISDSQTNTGSIVYDPGQNGNGMSTRSMLFDTYGDQYQLHMYSGFTGNHSRHVYSPNRLYGTATVASCPVPDIDFFVLLNGELTNRERQKRTDFYRANLLDLNPTVNIECV